VAWPGCSPWLIGYVSLRRSGIYFSILTLAFAQMSYNLAYSVLTPITNGETGLQVRWRAIRCIDLMGIIDQADPGIRRADHQPVRHEDERLSGLLLLRGHPDHLLLHRHVHLPSNFGMMLRAIKSNQNRMNYTGLQPAPYLTWQPS
jgi:ABC-type branched-subunit amino acid transport system permease subunit